VAARCVCGARLSLYAPTGQTQLGKYAILRRIAVGGMGEIFYGKLAGVEGFEREVAIKKMLPHLSEDRAFIDMMIKEAKLTVLLHHPNIVQVYDLAKEGREYYIAMEYVPGVTVGHLLETAYRTQTHLPVEVAVHIIIQVLRGLAYAHDLRGPTGEPMHILHRDITPQNIMVTRSAWVKITDFGIAKARNEISSTSPGIIKGKLGYIAPEQVTGATPDQRVDIFCAGILLWEALATRRLFKGTDEIDTFRIINECNVPPLSEFRDDVPAEVETALRGALTRQRDDRYRGADEFCNALNRAIFPHTADEYASIARRFFESKPELFDDVVAPGAKDDDAITAVEETRVVHTGQLADITNIADGRQRPRLTGGLSRNHLPVLAVAVALVVLLGVVALLVKDNLAATAESPEPEAAVVAQAAGGPNAYLTPDEVQLAVDGERARFLECYRLGNRSFRRLPALAAHLVIPSTGGVASVELAVSPRKLGSVGPCIKDLLARLKFRPHLDPKLETTVHLPPPNTVRPPPPQASTPAKPLTGKEIQTVVQRHSASIAKCLNGLAGVANAPTKVNATITISLAGRVTDVKLSPTLPRASVEVCLRKNLKAMRLRRQPVKDFKAAIPLTITQI
jgi:serine/threonine-protein kinase